MSGDKMQDLCDQPKSARVALYEKIPAWARRILIVTCEGSENRLSATVRRIREVIEVGPDVVQSPPGGNGHDPLAEAFDCVACNGTFGSLVNPDQFLRRARVWLTQQGRFIADIPNVRHHQSVTGLLGNAAGPGSIGATDCEQLRFFTRREIEKLFYRAGYGPAEIESIPGDGYDEWKKHGSPGEVKLAGLHIAGLPSGDAEDFFSRGFLVTATPRNVRQFGLTSIIVVTHNQLPYTHGCIESIRFRTDQPIELIFVDNGSTDGTVPYLRSLADVTLIENADNRGFPTAANQGIKASRGEHILLLNNDVLVSTGWLDRMLYALHADTDIGLAGPCTNNISGPQQVPVSYTDLSSFDGFAWEWGKTHHRQRVETDRLVGFCLLFRREVVDKIGLLDEQFGIGNFEDDDYCLRARRAGFRTVIASDAFIHHFGSRTFIGNGVDHAGLMKRNEALFRKKWESTREEAVRAASESQPSPVPDAQFSIRLASGDGGLLLEPKHIRLSLCMIVRDSARTLEPCLASIMPWVDEMVIVDTGSKDNTVEIAEKFGARVFHFPWCDDFAAARNESLRHARGEWIFWIDSDDTINPDNGRKLRELADRPLNSAPLAYVMQVHCPGGSEANDNEVTVVDHVKMFRNQPGLRFEGRIHEQVLPAVRRLNGEVAWTDVYVSHSGSDHSPEGRRQKHQRDLRLLELELADRPDHPFALFNLGMTYADMSEHRQAVSSLRRCLEVSGNKESHVRKAYALLVSSYTQLGKHDQAWEACRRAQELYPKDAELLFREGILAHHFGRFDEAVRAYQGALQNDDERHFSSIDRGISGFKARHNLALVYAAMGRFDLAEDQWRHAIEEVPGYRAGWRGLGDSLLRQQKWVEVEHDLGHMPDHPQLRCEAKMLRAEVAKARGDLLAARRELEEAAQEFPEDMDLLRSRCQFLFEHSDLNEAEAELQQLASLEPQDGAAHHNLGTLYVRMGRLSSAAGAYRESLRVRPGASHTQLELSRVLKILESTDATSSGWEDST